MPLPLFLGLLIALSIAMLATLVPFSRAVLSEGDHRDAIQRRGAVYLAIWVAIVALLYSFAGNQPVVFLIPIAFVALHALILWFATALQRVVLEERARPRPNIAIPEEEEEEEEIEEPPPPRPTLLQRIAKALLATLRWIVTLAIVLAIIAIGENIDALHRLDDAVAPHAQTIRTTLITTAALGFALFMGGVIRLLLKKDGQRVIAFGAILLMVSAALLGILLTTPGLKLLILIAVAYACIRIVIGLLRDTKIAD